MTDGKPGTYTPSDRPPRPSGLLPAERIALTVARAQLNRGESPTHNITAVLVMTIERLQEALAVAGDDEAVLRLNWHADRDKLVAVRSLAEQLGDRTDEPALPAPEVKVHLPVSDRRIVEPITRMLLEILDGKP